MDKSKLQVTRIESFTEALAEGNGTKLETAIKKYRETGKYSDVDFSPIVLGESRSEQFMAANLYGNPFCTMTVIQDMTKKQTTSLVAFGNRDLPLEFLVSFSEIMNLQTNIPSKKLIQEAKYARIPMLKLYLENLRAYGESVSAIILSEALKCQQQKYIEAARRDTLRN